MTCYGENCTAHLIKWWAVGGTVNCCCGHSDIWWTRRQEKVWKGPQLSQALWDRSFCRSKIPKGVWINVQNVSKQRQWESLTTDPCPYFVTFPAPNITSRLWLRNRGCREKHVLLHVSFKQRESHVKRRWCKFQASRYLSYKFLILIVFGIFRTTFLHVVVLLYSLFCWNQNHFKRNSQVLVPNEYTLKSSGEI